MERPTETERERGKGKKRESERKERFNSPLIWQVTVIPIIAKIVKHT